MNKKIAFFFLVFASTLLAETNTIVPDKNSCSVELFSKIYRLEANQTLSNQDIIHKTDCDVAVSNKISQILSNSNGSVGADFLKRELLKDFKTITIDITPRKLSLLELNSSLRDQLTNDSNLFFQNTNSLNGIKSLGLIEGEQLKANCESCTSFGEKNIKIDIANPLQNTTRTVWFSSRIMAKIKIFKAKRNLSFQQGHLDAEDFYSDEIFTSNPENALTSLNNIQFYKANRTIVQGSVVSNLDLQAVNLISFGTPVNVTLKNQNINLQRTAMPTRSALFGETIELRNPNNNKIIAGKVVDYNKVVIEL